jgi:hypothetical protein
MVKWDAPAMLFRRSPVVALVALAAFVGTLGLPLIASRHAFGDDVDLGWGEQQIGPGHPITQIERVRPAPADDHCALCHWARALGSSVTGAEARHVPPVTVGAVVRSHSSSDSTVALVAGSPRGPPISL